MTHPILITSNSMALRQSIYQDLIHNDFKVFEASNGQETLAVLETLDNMELLLIDVPLQDMDGIQLTRQIRDIAVYRFLPIIMLVSRRSKTLESEGLTAGITGWLNQPVTSEQLHTVVRRLIGE